MNKNTNKFSNKEYPATLLCDFYKISHREQYPEKTQRVYSTWIARESRLENVESVVAFGFQAFIKKYLIEYFNDNFFNRNLEDVVAEYTRVIKYTLNIENPDASHIIALHNLQHLPVEIKAVKEGSRVPLRMPMLTIVNTHNDFFWLTNYLETLMSTSLWTGSTSATIAYEYRQLLDTYAIDTTGSKDFVPFQGHDFSMRGISSLESSALSGAGHLLSFVGTDTIPAILFLEKYYKANIEKELVGTSISASEHSVMSSYGKENEFNTYKRLITEVYPSGMLSIVSDTWDLWKTLLDIIKPLKEEILARDGKIVIRPDCYDDKTEILTNNGWKLFLNLNSDDLVAQFDNGRISFVKPLKYFTDKYNGEMIRFYSDKNKIDLVVTPNHNMLRYNSDKYCYEKNTADKIKYNHLKDLPVAGQIIGEESELTWYQRLMIAFQADGRCKIESGHKSGNYILEFSFAKQRKIERLINICNMGNFKYKIEKNKSRQYTNNDKWNPQTTVTVYLEKEPYKTLQEWADYSNKSAIWCENFINEVSYWDATRRTEDRYKYDSTIKSNSIIVQIIAILAGFKTTFSCSSDDRSNNFSDIYTVHIIKNKNCVGGQSIKTESIQYNGWVYCVTVPSGNVVVRRNDQVVISGNSGNPVDIICGTAQIEDLYDCEDIKDAKCVMKEILSEQVSDETEHGEVGDDEVTGFFKFDNKTYKIVVSFDWNRHDKQYYYMDGSRVRSCEETQLTPSEKGVIEILWDIFGGSVTEQGYKVLNSHIGCIYGDAITIQRCEKICEKLKNKGFASTNMIYGIGSFTYQYNTRDTFGFAMKSTHIVIDGKEHNIFKDPVTDIGKVKKSLTGRVCVSQEAIDKPIKCIDGMDTEAYEKTKSTNLLKTIFVDGKLVRDDSLENIRKRLLQDKGSLLIEKCKECEGLGYYLLSCSANGATIPVLCNKCMAKDCLESCLSCEFVAPRYKEKLLCSKTMQENPELICNKYSKK